MEEMAIPKARLVHRTAFAALMGLWLSGCTAGAPSLRFSGQSAAAQLPQPIRGSEQVAALKPAYVVFGELHGTAEAPKFFGDVAASLVRQGKRILVAVELNASGNQDLQAAWIRQDGELSKTLDMSEWVQRRDGVTSKAMLDMLSGLQRLNAATGKVSIVAFNGYRDEAQRKRLEPLGRQAGHEAAQAENIAAATHMSAAEVTLVLVGNLHARKKPVERRGQSYDPMAMYLNRSGPLVALNMVYSGGTAWNCQMKADAKPASMMQITDDMVECANHPVAGMAGKTSEPYMAIGSTSDIDFGGLYDGYYWLGAISGSGPAVP